MSGKLKILILIVLFFSQNSNSLAATIEDMQLLGKGEVYYLKFIKVYNASLYSNNMKENKDILDNDVSKCLLLQYVVDVDKNDFITAANKILARQFTPEQLRRVTTELELLHSGYEDVEKGDSYTLCYDETTEITRLFLNGEERIAVTSSTFAEMYFSIWLGSSAPLDEKLRNDLLSKVTDT